MSIQSFYAHNYESATVVQFARLSNFKRGKGVVSLFNTCCESIASCTIRFDRDLKAIVFVILKRFVSDLIDVVQFLSLSVWLCPNWKNIEF